MWKHLVFAGLVLVVGCSGGNDDGSSGSSGGSGSTAGSSGGSTGGGSQTLTMTGPYSYSGPVTSTGYAVTGGSHTQVDVRVQVGADVVALTATLPVSAVAVQAYATADFDHFGLGVSEPHGTDMVTDSTDSVSLVVTQAQEEATGQTTLHGSMSVGYHGTQALPDGGSASGAGTVDATF